MPARPGQSAPLFFMKALPLLLAAATLPLAGCLTLKPNNRKDGVVLMEMAIDEPDPAPRPTAFSEPVPAR